MAGLSPILTLLLAGCFLESCFGDTCPSTGIDVKDRVEGCLKTHGLLIEKPGDLANRHRIPIIEKCQNREMTEFDDIIICLSDIGHDCKTNVNMTQLLNEIVSIWQISETFDYICNTTVIPMIEDNRKCIIEQANTGNLSCHDMVRQNYTAELKEAQQLHPFDATILENLFPYLCPFMDNMHTCTVRAFTDCGKNVTDLISTLLYSMSYPVCAQYREAYMNITMTTQPTTPPTPGAQGSVDQTTKSAGHKTATSHISKIIAAMCIYTGFNSSRP